MKAAAGALGLATVGGIATAHPPGANSDHADLGDQFDGNRANATENTDLVGYHSAGGVGPASLSGDPDDPHYGGLSELRIHDDLAFLSIFSSRDDTPNRGVAILDVSDFTRAESREDLEQAEIGVLSFVRNDNSAAACMDVKVSDDGNYAFLCKQPYTVLFDEGSDEFDDDDHGNSADAASLDVIDASDPGNPEVVASYGAWTVGPHNCWHHQIGGQEYVFTGHGGDGATGAVNVFRFDRGTETLEHVNTWTFDQELADGEVGTDGTFYYAHDVVVQDDPKDGRPVLYVANWDAGTRIVDASDPTDLEEIGLFEMEKSHHTVCAPTLIDGKRVFVTGHENPDSTENYTRTEGASGHYYLVDADPLDEVLVGDREEPVYLGISSTMADDGVEPATREATEMYDPSDEEAARRELDHWILFESVEQTYDETPGFEEEAADEDMEYDGFGDFNLSSHNLDIDHEGRIVAGHYHAGTRFLEIDSDDWTIEEIGYHRVGKDVPEESTLGDLTTATPNHWCAVQRNGVTFAGDINAGPTAIAHDEFAVGEDTPIDLEIEREADASLFTAGQTSQVRIHVDADEPVQVRDRVPADWEVDEEHSPVTVEPVGDDHRQVVTFDETVADGTLRYYVTVPEDATDTYTVGPVEYARPDVAGEYGGGVTVNNFCWRKENDEVDEQTVVELDI